jgi:hypothetical protein
MGSYTFSWEHPAGEVYVTGDFDDWKQTIKLEKEGSIFKKTVDLPKAKHQYKFVVDGNWVTNESAPKEADSSGNFNNVLNPDDITEPVSTPAVPTENGKTTSQESIPGSFPLTPPAETPLNEPEAFSINPIPATEGPGNPTKLEPGEKVPDPSTFTNNTVQSTVTEDKEPELEEKVSVAPIPATAGAGNPIHLAPGEKVPDPSTLTANTVDSTATTDVASYEKSDNAPPQLGPVVTPEAEREAKGDPGFTIQSAAPTSTTAALAGEVPKEPQIPEVVKESQKEAGFPPEASANPEVVEEKKELEQELKEKVPEEPAATESSTTEQAAAAATATAGAFAAATYAAKDKAAEAVGLNGQATASDVPEVVQESQKEAHVDPEASANPEAVEEKKEVESELLKEVKKTDEAGEPAPTVAAATSETAPGLSETALAETKPLKSSSEPDALNASASKPAIPETSQPEIDSRDVSPMSKKPTIEQTQPTVTTGAGETTTTDAKTTAETPKKEGSAAPESVASAVTDKEKKKKNRRSFFGKLKDKFSK